MDMKKSIINGAGNGVAGGVILGFAGAAAICVGLPFLGAYAAATAVSGTALSILCGIGGFVGGAFAARFAAPMAFVTLTAAGTIGGTAIGAAVGVIGKTVDFAMAPWKKGLSKILPLGKSKAAKTAASTPAMPAAQNSALTGKSAKKDFGGHKTAEPEKKAPKQAPKQAPK